MQVIMQVTTQRALTENLSAKIMGKMKKHAERLGVASSIKDNAGVKSGQEYAWKITKMTMLNLQLRNIQRN